MKIRGELYEQMRAAFRAVVEHHGGASEVRRKFSFCANRTQLVWAVWQVANDNLMYDDTHPWFRSGRWVRIVPHTGLNPYAADDTVNDSHIETALMKIATEIGL